MTTEQMYSLQEVLNEVLDKFPGDPVRQLANWLRLHRRGVIDANLETLSIDGLCMRLRALRKNRSPKEEEKYSANLCFDFGLPNLEIDTEISVPRDPENLMNSVCDWPEPDDATIDQIDLHILLLEAQGHATLRHAENWHKIRQVAMRHSPGGRTNITLGELRRIARRKKEK